MKNSKNQETGKRGMDQTKERSSDQSILHWILHRPIDWSGFRPVKKARRFSPRAFCCSPDCSKLQPDYFCSADIKCSFYGSSI